MTLSAAPTPLTDAELVRAASALNRLVASLRNVLFCAYPSDACQVVNNATKGCPQGKICVPKTTYQGRECGAPPPTYREP